MEAQQEISTENELMSKNSSWIKEMEKSQCESTTVQGKKSVIVIMM